MLGPPRSAFARFLLERFTDLRAPITLAADGTVFGRAGRTVFGASWHHNNAAPRGGLRFGNCFVVVGLAVRVPTLGERAWCLRATRAERGLLGGPEAIEVYRCIASAMGLAY